MIRTLIVGGGASGLSAAVAAGEKGDEVFLFERQNKPGRKILASGNGRCNIMNRGPLVYYGDSDFASKVFTACPQNEIIRFWERNGLSLRTDAENRVYPATFRSATVSETLTRSIKLYNVRLFQDTEIVSVKKENSMFVSSDNKSNLYYSDRVIVACGGMAQPLLGGTDSGYRLLAAFGHHINPPRPALTPLKTDPKSVSGLDGIRAKCRLTLKTNDKILHTETGEVLFSKEGISGICVMQCARFVENNNCTIELDFVYDLFDNEESVISCLSRRRETLLDFKPMALIEGFCAPRLAFAICKQADLELRSETCAHLNDRQIRALAYRLRHYTLRIDGIMGFDRAQVTAGGARCDEFDPKTMQSKLVKGLFAAGEVLDVDGDCGGFNLMFAWAGGLLAGGFGGERHAEG